MLIAEYTVYRLCSDSFIHVNLRGFSSIGKAMKPVGLLKK